MNTRDLMMTLLLVGTMLGVGCKDEAPPTSPTPTPDTPAPEAADADTDDEAEAVTGEDVRREAGEAVDATAAWADQEKDKFVATSREKLDELKARWSSWSEDAGEKTDEVKADLNKRYEQAAAKLEEVKESSGGAWAEMRDGFVAAYEDLEAATREAADAFNGEEAEVPAEEQAQDETP